MKNIFYKTVPLFLLFILFLGNIEAAVEEEWEQGIVRRYGDNHYPDERTQTVEILKGIKTERGKAFIQEVAQKYLSNSIEVEEQVTKNTILRNLSEVALADHDSLIKKMVAYLEKEQVVLDRMGLYELCLLHNGEWILEMSASFLPRVSQDTKSH